MVASFYTGWEEEANPGVYPKGGQRAMATQILFLEFNFKKTQNFAYLFIKYRSEMS